MTKEEALRRHNEEVDVRFYYELVWGICPTKEQIDKSIMDRKRESVTQIVQLLNDLCFTNGGA